MPEPTALTSHATEAYLERETIVRMDWPALWPDLNRTEHACDMLQRAVFSRPAPGFKLSSNIYH